MLTIQEIVRQYPEFLQTFRRDILREYLQYKILEIIFTSKFGNRLSFLGGTALRIIYNNTRFSEDLDFDNFGLTMGEFDEIAEKVKNGLEKNGLRVEINTVSRGAYRCNVRLPDILFANELSPNRDEKILIQLDTAPHGYAYTPEPKLLNKFDVTREILVTPPSMLLAQKFFAATNRPRAKGRDFYDILFLSSFCKPDYSYLSEKMGIKNAEELRVNIIEKTAAWDFKKLAQDVRPFLFHPDDTRKIEMFPKFIKQINL